MKNLDLFFSFFVFLSFSSHAQYINTSAEAASKIKNYVLLVGLAEEDSRVIKSMDGNQESIRNYKNNIIGMNYALKNAVDSFWHFSAEVKIMPLSKAKALIKSEQTKYALLNYGEELAPEMWHLGSSNERKQVPGWIVNNGKFIYKMECRDFMPNLKIFPLEITLSKKVFEIYFSSACPSEGDLIFAINYVQRTLTFLLSEGGSSVNKYYRETSQRANELQHKTLLVDQYDLNSKLKSADLAKIYSYPIKVVPYTEIEKALKRKDSTVAILYIARYDPQNSFYTVTDANTGMLYYSKSSYTFEYGQQNGSFSMMYYTAGLTSGILTEIDTEAK